MHPDAAFRHDADSARGSARGSAVLEALIDEIGFGMVFAATPDGPRVAHAPLMETGDGAIQFHLSRGNALAKHLNGETALIVINGPEGYVSPRWYADTRQVPTWNYIALELEGRVRRMDGDGLTGHLDALVQRQEARVSGGEAWHMAQMPADKLRGLMAGIIGFELEVQAWRPTFKLSQNKPAEERERVAAGLEAQGSLAMARLMRTLAP